MPSRSLLFLPLFLFTTLSHAQYEQLLHKTHAERFKQFYRIFVMYGEIDSAESAGKVIDIEKLAIENDDEDLLLEMKLYSFGRIYTGLPGNLLDSVVQGIT